LPHRLFLDLSIKTRVALAATAVSIALLVIVNAVQTRYLREELVHTFSGEQFALAARAASELDSKLATYKQILAANAAVLHAEQLASADGVRAHFKSRPAVFAAFDDLLVFAPDGHMLADMPAVPGRMQVNLAGSDFFKRVLVAGEPVLSEPSLGRAQQRPIVQIGMPVLDDTGRPIAVLLGVLRLSGGNFVADLAETRVGEGGYLLVMTTGPKPVYVVHPDASLLGQPRPANAPAATLRALGGFEGSLIDTDSRGVPVMVSYKRLKNAPWLLVVRVPLETVLAPLARAERRLWLISAAAAALLLPLIWLGTAAALSPLSRLRDGIDHLQRDGAAGLPALRDDEIGAVGTSLRAALIAREAAEARESETARRLSLIADNVPALITYIDTGLVVTYANRAVCAVLRIPQESFQPTPLRELLPAALYEQRLPHLARVLRGETSAFIGLQEVDGHRRRHAIAYVPDFDPAAGAAAPPAPASDAAAAQDDWPDPEHPLPHPAPGLRGFYVLMHDIEDAEHAREALAGANAQLEERVAQRTADLQRANRELETFSYSVAHNFRAPLRAMQGYGSLLLTGVQAMDEEARGHVERIRHASLNLAQMIDGLLRLAGLPQQVRDRAPVGLEGLARDIVLRRQAASPQARIEFSVEPMPPALADARLAGMLLEELIDNACKFSSGAAQPRVRIGHHPHPPGIDAAAGAWFVEDNGAGYDMAHAARMFQPFERVHAADEFPGTGIGLAIVQRIVEAHGGALHAESAPDAGATIYFTLGDTAGHAGAPP
jgi:signal transduction histidine kinase